MSILFNLLDLFDGYFLILVLIQGFVLRILDYKHFKEQRMDRAAKQCKSISFFSVAIVVALYVARIIFL